MLGAGAVAGYAYLNGKTPLDVIGMLKKTIFSDMSSEIEPSEIDEEQNTEKVIVENIVSQISESDIYKELDQSVSAKYSLVDAVYKTAGDDYVFLLGFNKENYPKVYKNNEYFSNVERETLGLDTSLELNIKERESLINEAMEVLCLSKDAVAASAPLACINCGRCVEACPELLVPSKLMKFSERGLMDEYEKWMGLECIECGSCSYVCPSRRQVAQSIKTMKKLVLAEKRKQQSK